MNDDVESVETERRKPCQHVVETESDGAEGAVGLVRTTVEQRRAPEIVAEDGPETRLPQHVRISFYRSAIRKIAQNI